MLGIVSVLGGGGSKTPFRLLPATGDFRWQKSPVGLPLVLRSKSRPRHPVSDRGYWAFFFTVQLHGAKFRLGTVHRLVKI